MDKLRITKNLAERMKAYPKLSVESIAKNLDARIKAQHPDSRAASSDDVALAFLLAEISTLNKKLDFQDRTGCARKTSKRGFNFMMFACEVLDHIEEYTIPQYGDEGEDQITEWTAEDCLKSLKRYIARYGKMSVTVSRCLISKR